MTQSKRPLILLGATLIVGAIIAALIAWPHLVPGRNALGQAEPLTEVTIPAAVDETQFPDYLDAPLTPGTWRYSDDPVSSVAEYGDDGEPDFAILCDRETGSVGLNFTLRASSSGAQTLTVKTETATQQLQASPHLQSYLAATIAADDPFLDAIALSRGRIAVAVEGEQTLYLAAWVEISRVIEDCR